MKSTEDVVFKEAVLSEYRILEVRPPVTGELEQDINWICRCLGFANPRDTENTAIKIFRVLLDNAKVDEPLASDEIADEVGLTRGAVVHHLNRMRRSNLVIRRDNKYELRMHSLQKTLEEVERDILRVLRSLKEVAKEIDSQLGMPYR